MLPSSVLVKLTLLLVHAVTADSFTEVELTHVVHYAYITEHQTVLVDAVAALAEARQRRANGKAPFVRAARGPRAFDHGRSRRRGRREGAATAEVFEPSNAADVEVPALEAPPALPPPAEAMVAAYISKRVPASVRKAASVPPAPERKTLPTHQSAPERESMPSLSRAPVLQLAQAAPGVARRVPRFVGAMAGTSASRDAGTRNSDGENRRSVGENDNAEIAKLLGSAWSSNVGVSDAAASESDANRARPVPISRQPATAMPAVSRPQVASEQSPVGAAAATANAAAPATGTNALAEDAKPVVPAEDVQSAPVTAGATATAASRASARASADRDSGYGRLSLRKRKQRPERPTKPPRQPGDPTPRQLKRAAKFGNPLPGTVSTGASTGAAAAATAAATGAQRASDSDAVSGAQVQGATSEEAVSSVRTAWHHMSSSQTHTGGSHAVGGSTKTPASQPTLAQTRAAVAQRLDLRRAGPSPARTATAPTAAAAADAPAGPGPTTAPTSASAPAGASVGPASGPAVPTAPTTAAASATASNTDPLAASASASAASRLTAPSTATANAARALAAGAARKATYGPPPPPRASRPALDVTSSAKPTHTMRPVTRMGRAALPVKLSAGAKKPTLNTTAVERKPAVGQATERRSAPAMSATEQAPKSQQPKQRAEAEQSADRQALHTVGFRIGSVAGRQDTNTSAAASTAAESAVSHAASVGQAGKQTPTEDQAAASSASFIAGTDAVRLRLQEASDSPENVKSVPAQEAQRVVAQPSQQTSAAPAEQPKKQRGKLLAKLQAVRYRQQEQALQEERAAQQFASMAASAAQSPVQAPEAAPGSAPEAGNASTIADVKAAALQNTDAADGAGAASSVEAAVSQPFKSPDGLQQPVEHSSSEPALQESVPGVLQQEEPQQQLKAQQALGEQAQEVLQPAEDAPAGPHAAVAATAAHAERLDEAHGRAVSNETAADTSENGAASAVSDTAGDSSTSSSSGASVSDMGVEELMLPGGRFAARSAASGRQASTKASSHTAARDSAGTAAVGAATGAADDSSSGAGNARGTTSTDRTTVRGQRFAARSASAQEQQRLRSAARKAIADLKSREIKSQAEDATAPSSEQGAASVTAPELDTAGAAAKGSIRAERAGTVAGDVAAPVVPSMIWQQLVSGGAADADNTSRSADTSAKSERAKSHALSEQAGSESDSADESSTADAVADALAMAKELREQEESANAISANRDAVERWRAKRLLRRRGYRRKYIVKDEDRQASAPKAPPASAAASAATAPASAPSMPAVSAGTARKGIKQQPTEAARSAAAKAGMQPSARSVASAGIQQKAGPQRAQAATPAAAKVGAQPSPPPAAAGGQAAEAKPAEYGAAAAAAAIQAADSAAAKSSADRPAEPAKKEASGSTASDVGGSASVAPERKASGDAVPWVPLPPNLATHSVASKPSASSAASTAAGSDAAGATDTKSGKDTDSKPVQAANSDAQQRLAALATNLAQASKAKRGADASVAQSTPKRRADPNASRFQRKFDAKVKSAVANALKPSTVSPMQHSGTSEDAALSAPAQQSQDAQQGSPDPAQAARASASQQPQDVEPSSAGAAPSAMPSTAQESQAVEHISPSAEEAATPFTSASNSASRDALELSRDATDRADWFATASRGKMVQADSGMRSAMAAQGANVETKWIQSGAETADAAQWQLAQGNGVPHDDLFGPAMKVWKVGNSGSGNGRDEDTTSGEASGGQAAPGAQAASKAAQRSRPLADALAKRKQRSSAATLLSRCGASARDAPPQSPP